MIGAWAGKLASGCGPSGCTDCPTEREPVCIECPECGQRGCAECNHLGTFDLCECPRKFVDLKYWQLLRFSSLFRKGNPPINGGVLDQENWFMSACEFLWAEQDRVVPPSML